MPYNENIPLATDLKSQSQADIKENFTQIKTLVDINHVTFGDGDQGKHKYVTLPEQGADPGLVEASQATVYTKQSAVTTNTGLFWQGEGDGVAAGDVIEMTAKKINGDLGYTYLPSGIIIHFGKGTATGGGAGALNTFTGGGFPNNCYSVVITQICAVGNYDLVQVITGTISNTTFRATSYDVNGNATTYSIYYIAIGD